jgi:hypothetical protein
MMKAITPFPVQRWPTWSGSWQSSPKPIVSWKSFIEHAQEPQDAENVRQRRSRIVQTLNVPQGYALGPSLAAALLDGHFEHPE